MRYLSPENRIVLGEFLGKPLWGEIKLCLLDRRPVAADTNDPSHVAAAKGHKRAGYEIALEAIEKLVVEYSEDAPDPFLRPAVAITAD